MGTRADFYIGRGKDAEWLGSIAWDGYPDGIPDEIKRAVTEQDFRSRVAAFIAERKDGTKPEDGWPWPWEDSRTTDYSYAFDQVRVYGSCFGHAWFDAQEEEPEREDNEDKVNFPNMKSRKNVTLGPRSGVIIVGVK